VISRRRRVIDLLSAWSPALLLGALAALTWWLDAQIVDSGQRRDGATRHDPDLVVEGVRVVELDAKGNAVQTRHYPDDGTVEFDAPRVVLTQPNRPKFTVEAARGRVSGDRENAYFEGNVRATREADAGEASSDDGPAGPIRLTTEYLHVIPREDRAQTDRAVTIEEPRGIIRATGLVLDNASRSLKFNTNVRGTLAPPSN
jgi:lipopolysaccharide export system protein LptC